MNPNQIFLIVIALWLALLIVCFMFMREVDRRKTAEKDRDGWQEFAMDKSATLQRSLACDCRLIDIQRNGRSNYFTFMRNDQTFTIETMGLLSDDISTWRNQAGLDRGW